MSLDVCIKISDGKKEIYLPRVIFVKLFNYCNDPWIDLLYLPDTANLITHYQKNNPSQNTTSNNCAKELYSLIIY